jgi:hypothetical protein
MPPGFGFGILPFQINGARKRKPKWHVGPASDSKHAIMFQTIVFLKFVHKRSAFYGLACGTKVRAHARLFTALKEQPAAISSASYCACMQTCLQNWLHKGTICFKSRVC